MNPLRRRIVVEAPASAYSDTISVVRSVPIVPLPSGIASKPHRSARITFHLESPL
jgi:hypothetical protein